MNSFLKLAAVSLALLSLFPVPAFSQNTISGTWFDYVTSYSQSGGVVQLTVKGNVYGSLHGPYVNIVEINTVSQTYHGLTVCSCNPELIFTGTGAANQTNQALYFESAVLKVYDSNLQYLFSLQIYGLFNVTCLCEYGIYRGS